jgi:cell pole-organizing protein PopZ
MRAAAESPAMSDSDNAQQEPTMEEILASIRRIISEDSEEEVAVEAAPQFAETEEVSQAEDDIFDLTDVVEEELSLVQPPEPARQVAPEPAPVQAPAVAVQPAPAPEYSAPEPEPVLAADQLGLLGEEAAGAAMAAFGNLSRSATVGSATTIEEIVVASLRPMLKGWLDENLAGIVEELVQREIDRVAGRGSVS